MATDKEYEEQLSEISQRVERLRVHYQAYFLGMEKRPPMLLREQFDRFLRETSLHEARRATYKFRFQALQQRYRILAVYWDRVMRDLEEGRITRESLRRDAGYRDRDDARPDARTDVPLPGRPALPEPLPDADPVAQLYVDYIAARRQAGMAIQGITESAFRASLEKQRALQRERLGVPDVAFSVTVKDGKVVLLARPVSVP
ncbi:MAG TPA: MXAN_5187 C-terminal domain-containing protein [Myxococcota bacterium]|nr:MXAN_5187 C-terminal domain-containing protein [Myxococcota bacterium]